MRESIGGTMLFWIVLFFMSLFISFMAFVINYAKVYKIKNSMINYIERSEGITSKDEFESELTFLGYPKNEKYELCKYEPTDVGGYYSLELYMTLEFPIVSGALPINISVKGETRNIETGVHIKNKDVVWQCLENPGCCTR